MIASAPTQVHEHKTANPLPRRVLMTADPIGGVWSYALELAWGLSGHGVEIVLASMGQALSADDRRIPGRLPGRLPPASGEAVGSP